MAASPQELIRQRLAAGAHRMKLGEALETASWTALAALGAMAALVLAQKVFFLGLPARLPVLSALGMPGWALWALLALLAAPAVAGLIRYALSEKGVLSAAMAADQRLGLRARISSAVALGEAPRAGSPMVPALLGDARRCAELLRPARDFPVRAPRGAMFLPFGLCVLGLAMVFVPQGDVFGRERRRGRQDEEREQLREAAREMEEKLLEALKRRAPEKREGQAATPGDKLMDELSELVKELKDVEDRAQAMTRLNQLLDKTRLTEMRLASMDAMMRQMERLRELGEKADLPKGPAGSAAAAMAAGDFKKAAEEMEKLKEMLKEQGGLKDEQKEELKRELEKLAKLTDDWKELAGQLRKAADRLGEDGGFEAMDEAIDDLKELAELLKELGLEPGEGLGGEGQRVQLTREMIDQLKDMLKNAQRCDQCKKMHCLGCGKPRCACSGEEQCDCPPGGGDCMLVPIPGAGQGQGQGQGSGGSDQKGPGMGGPGQGEGGKAPEEEHDVKLQTTKVRGQMGEGRIVSHMFVKGAPSVTDDEKKTQFREAHGAAQRAASEEISSGRIPRELRDYVREYFDSTKPAAPAEKDEKDREKK